MVVLLSGTVFLLILLPFIFIQFFWTPWMEVQAAARAPRALPEETAGHVLLTHWDVVSAALVDRLDRYGIPYALIVPGLQEALRLSDEGVRVMVGEVDDPETWRRARVRRPRWWPRPATTSPTRTWPSRLARREHDPEPAEAQPDPDAGGLDLFKVFVPPALVGRTIAESGVRERSGASIVAGERMEVNPDPGAQLPAGAEIILIGSVEDEHRFLSLFQDGERGRRRWPWSRRGIPSAKSAPRNLVPPVGAAGEGAQRE